MQQQQLRSSLVTLSFCLNLHLLGAQESRGVANIFTIQQEFLFFNLLEKNPITPDILPILLRQVDRHK
jgi:hypothetical protein